MASFDLSTYNTIYKEKTGVWTLVTCSGFTAVVQYSITAGEPCTEPSGSTFKTDGTSQCYECIGYEFSEIKIVQFNTNPSYSYLKIALSFDEQGGTSVADKFIYYGRTYGTLPTPTRSGYTFNGWFTLASGGSQVLSTTTVTQSSGLTQTLYAQWTAQTPTTATPTIHIQYVPPFNIAEFRVRNVDSSGSAVILANAGVNPPTTNRGTIASSSYTSWIGLNCQQDNCGFTVYATAQVSGENKSAVRALYVQ